jgi:hypothetical protein
MFFKYIASRILPFWIVLENQDCGVCEVMQAVVDFCDVPFVICLEVQELRPREKRTPGVRFNVRPSSL